MKFWAMPESSRPHRTTLRHASVLEAGIRWTATGVTRTSPVRSFVEVVPRCARRRCAGLTRVSARFRGDASPWRGRHPGARACRPQLTARSLPNTCRAPVLISVAVLAISGCGADERANDLARDYLRAAADGDVKRLCA